MKLSTKLEKKLIYTQAEIKNKTRILRNNENCSTKK